MNRRELISSAAVLPMLPTLQREDGWSLLIDDSVRVRIRVYALPTPTSAERTRRHWIGQPFESEGEWYELSTEARALPPDLADMPGTVTFHTTVVGAAAVEATFLVGAFRRENVAIIVRVSGNNMDLMTDFAEFLAATEVPDPWALLWSDQALARFYPTEETLGRTVEQIDDLWP